MAISYNDQRDVSLKEVIGQYAKNAIVQMYTQLPCVITKYDAANQIASIQPLTKQWVFDEDLKGGGKIIEMPEIREVSIAFARSGNIVFTWPVQVGDECIVEFMHKSSVNAIKTGQIGELLHTDNGQIQDCVGVLKQFSIPKHQEVVSPSSSAAEIRTVDGNAKISISNDGNEVVINLGDTSLTINEGTITINNANLIVNGNISSNGEVSDQTRSMSGDRTIYNSHTHLSNGAGNQTNTTTQTQ